MMQENILVRLINVKTDSMIRAYETPNLSETLKMYHYMINKDGLFIKIKDDNFNPDNDTFEEERQCVVKDIEVLFGGNTYLTCIDVYVEVF